MLSAGASTIDDARAALRDPQPFGRASQLSAFQALLDEAERIRITLAKLTRLLSLGRPDADAHLHLGLVNASAVMLDDIASAVTEDRPPGTARGRRGKRSPVDRAGPVAVARYLEAIEAAPVSGSDWIGCELLHTARALGGQLRAAYRVAAAAAGESNAALPSRAGRPTPARRRVAEVLGYAIVTLRANISWQSGAFRHAVRLAATLAICAAVPRLGGLARGYWVGMTALVVLRPDYTSTAIRGLSRVVGTLAGAVLATLLVVWLRPGAAGLAVLLAVAVLLGYAVVRANYALFSIAVTAYVVFLLAFAGPSGPCHRL